MNYIFYNSIGYVIIIKQLFFIIIKFANIVRMTLLIFIMYLFQERTLDTSYIVEWPCFYLVQIRLKFDSHHFEDLNLFIRQFPNYCLFALTFPEKVLITSVIIITLYVKCVNVLWLLFYFKFYNEFLLKFYHPLSP